ncbi:DUF4112 domain-containing protein [Haloarchaeobius sp. TZWWS8]|uniref:DUF4112 domain-containing protein n=1 Tax=Haloarchaeobius sp. TZWWS8 TaxID=3446121 RepID=UPI003EB8632F
MEETTHPAVRRAELVAWLLDESIRIPGTDRRIGLDPVLGLVPGLGDAAATALSLYVIVEAWRAGVSKPTIGRMVANVAVDAGIGAIPVIGDLFDAAWKANEKNVDLLKRSLEN